MMVDISESEAIEAGFDLRLKNYRTFEGTGVTFHCKTTGYPLPKVLQTCMTFLYLKKPSGALLENTLNHLTVINSTFYTENGKSQKKCHLLF